MTEMESKVSALDVNGLLMAFYKGRLNLRETEEAISSRVGASALSARVVELEEALGDLLGSMPPFADVHGGPFSECRFCAEKWEQFVLAVDRARALSSSVSDREKGTEG